MKMKTIKFNDLDERRDPKNVLPLSLHEQETVIDALNYLLENDKGNIADTWFDLLQRFVDNYSKLEHHKATTVGLQAFDSDPRTLLYEFWQRSSDACPLEVGEAEKQEELFKQWVTPAIIDITF